MLFGVLGAFSFGTGDFLGGFSARLLGSLRTTWVSASFGSMVLAVIVSILGGVWSADAVLWGALSGIAAVFGLVFLYGSLAIGPMSILSPVGALVAAGVPVMWELAIGEKLSALAYVGIVIALIAVWFVGFAPSEDLQRPSARGLIFAVLAGCFIGAFLILIDNAPDDAALLPLLVNRLTQTALLSIAVLITVIWHTLHKRRNPLSDRFERSDVFTGEGGVINWRRGTLFALAAGSLDAIGNTFIMSGLILGNLSVVSVLSSLYPGGTIVLAALVLRERIVKLQYFGFALALVAAVLLALS